MEQKQFFYINQNKQIKNTIDLLGNTTGNTVILETKKQINNNINNNNINKCNNYLIQKSNEIRKENKTAQKNIKNIPLESPINNNNYNKNKYYNYKDYKNKQIEISPRLKKRKSIEKNGKLLYNIDMNLETQYSFIEPIISSNNQMKSNQKIFYEKPRDNNVKSIKENNNINTIESNPYRSKKKEKNKQEINNNFNNNQIIKESENVSSNNNLLLLNTIKSIPFQSNCTNNEINSLYRVNPLINLGQTTTSIYQMQNSNNNEEKNKNNQNLKFELNKKSFKPNNTIIITKINEDNKNNSNNLQSMKINSGLENFPSTVSIPLPNSQIKNNNNMNNINNNLSENPLYDSNQNVQI